MSQNAKITGSEKEISHKRETNIHLSSFSDLCPSGFFLVRTGQCLQIFNTVVSRDAAKLNCQNIGAALVSIRTKDQENAVGHFVNASGFSGMFC